MYILGISCYYHDASAALLKDGKIIAAAEEERFTRKKHDISFPINAINYCLKSQKITINEIDYIGFYEKPFIKLERILSQHLENFPFSFKTFLSSMPSWINEKIRVIKTIRKKLKYKEDILFIEHHLAHAASSFLLSPFKKSAILTIDGVGEWTTTAYGIGEDNNIHLEKEIKFPNSLGLLYSTITAYLGFTVNNAEYKVMGLAPYGEPKYVQLIRDHLIDLKEDGSFKLNQEYFNYSVGLTMTNRKFNKLFGGLPRKPETLLTQKEMDLARSVQVVTEEAILRMAKHVRKQTGMKNLCLAGGVALNCVANGLVLRQKIFDRIWIQPAAGDAGGALGAALYVWYRYLDNPRKADPDKDMQCGSYLGPHYSDEEIHVYLQKNNIPHEKLNDGELPVKVAELLAQEKVVGWFNGRMEFGPRALGGRSIIGDARSRTMQSVMNLKIKFRESFRPFAPSVLRERVSDYFEMEVESPYMLLVAPVKNDKRLNMTEKEQKLFGIEKLNVPRSQIPAITHVDYSARVQTVSQEDNPEYYQMIKKFEEKTGCPVIINTSFNVRGEPIVCSPEHAYICFMRTNMDYLVMGNYLLDKTKQPEFKEDKDWKKEFELD